MREMTRTMETMLDNLSAADKKLLKMLAQEDHGQLLNTILHAVAVEVRAPEQADQESLAAQEADLRADFDARFPAPPPPPATGPAWYPEGEHRDEPPC